MRLHQTPPPSKDNVDEVARRVRHRALRWLRRHGYLDERAAEERGNEPAEPDALQGCMQLALAGGTFVSRPFVAEAREIFSRVYATATIEPRRDAPFGCALDASSFGAVRAVTAEWAGGGRAFLPAIGEHYILHFSAGGECTGVHAGEPFVVVPGRGAALLSPGRPSLHNSTPGFQGRTLAIDRWNSCGSAVSSSRTAIWPSPRPAPRSRAS